MSLSNVSIDQKIGEGNFGSVFKGTMNGKEVALKSLKDQEKQQELQAEIKILSKLDHNNIVHFFGMTVVNHMTMIVMEYINSSDLLTYLLSGVEHKEKRFINSQALQLVKEIAYGMEYLHSKDIVHRDLAARNVLLNISNYTITPKITDFGLARESQNSNYYSIQNSLDIPVRWTAPEVFTYRKYYKQSDVYSYGILIGEVYSRGQTPWKNVLNNQDVIDKVLKKEIHPQPDNCPNEIYEIMKKNVLFTRLMKDPHFSMSLNYSIFLHQPNTQN